jgi:hypothetical protein
MRGNAGFAQSRASQFVCGDEDMRDADWREPDEAQAVAPPMAPWNTAGGHPGGE